MQQHFMGIATLAVTAGIALVQPARAGSAWIEGHNCHVQTFAGDLIVTKALIADAKAGKSNLTPDQTDLVRQLPDDPQRACPLIGSALARLGY